MNWDTHLRMADGVEINRVADGYIVYHPERDRVHYLNHTAVLLLEFCNGQTAARELPALLQAAYSLSEAPTEEVARCLGQLLDEGLVR
jgi:hypothetical protein